MSALQKARAHYDQQPRQERAATGNAAGSAGLGMRHLEVRLLSDSLRASKLHAHLQSQRGFAHLQSLHLSAGQALPPRSSSYLGAPCAPCGRQCRCATCAPCARQCRCAPCALLRQAMQVHRMRHLHQAMQVCCVHRLSSTNPLLCCQLGKRQAVAGAVQPCRCLGDGVLYLDV